VAIPPTSPCRLSTAGNQSESSGRNIALLGHVQDVRGSQIYHPAFNGCPSNGYALFHSTLTHSAYHCLLLVYGEPPRPNTLLNYLPPPQISHLARSLVQPTLSRLEYKKKWPKSSCLFLHSGNQRYHPALPTDTNSNSPWSFISLLLEISNL